MHHCLCIFVHIVDKKYADNSWEINLKMQFTTIARICRLLAHFYVVD